MNSVEAYVEMEVVSGVERIMVLDLHTPGVAEGVHDNLVGVVETEVDVKNNVRPRKKFDGEVLVVSVLNMSVNVDLGSIMDLLVESNDARNGLNTKTFHLKLFRNARGCEQRACC